MAGSPATLSIKIVSDASDATKDFQATGRAAADMGDTVSAASKQAADSARRLDGVAESADNMATKSSVATGALGALSSGFELVGLEAYAGGLQAAAMATDFMSGVGDALTLVMESSAVTWIKNTAASAANKVATVASTVATGAQTAAQWALNAAMAASPVLLIVAGVAALVAVVVLAYKKSETFRRIVTGAFDAIKAAASAAFNWVKSNWPLLLAIITGPIGLAVLAVVKNWDKIKAGATAVKDGIKTAFERARDLVRDAFDAMRTKAEAIGEFLLAPFNAVKAVIESVVNLIKDIDLGFLGDVLGKIPLPGRGRSVTTSASVLGTAGGTVQPAQASTVVNLTVTGAVDPISTGRQIVEILTDYLRSTGQTTLVVTA